MEIFKLPEQETETGALEEKSVARAQRKTLKKRRRSNRCCLHALSECHCAVSVLCLFILLEDATHQAIIMLIHRVNNTNQSSLN